MKKIIFLLFSCAFLLSSAFAIGDGNIDGGGGDLGGGSGGNSWSSGNEGVRVTVLNATNGVQVTTPIDYTNVKPNDINIHFNKVSKQQYKSGVGLKLNVSSKYTFKNPTESIPKIITSSGGNANIEAIKKYFCAKDTVEMISLDTGIAYDNLISGKYKLLLEPIAYLKYSGFNFAMTATEGALYNMATSGDLQSKMGSLTHQNLPLSMYLARPDLGYPAWSGTTASRVTNTQITTSLGLGIISFPSEPEVPDTSNILHYTYRTNTEVISSIKVYSGDEISPDDNAFVVFNIAGFTYSKQFVCPPSSTQLVWVKWTTPSTPQDMQINVSTTKGRLETSALNIKIEELTEKEPPDPTSRDKNSNFRLPIVPTKESNRSASWSEWWAYWKENWVWYESLMRWVDEGWWIYEQNHYTASLVNQMKLRPDDDCPTASMRGSIPLMKSGYGVEVEILSNRSSTATNYDTTTAQNAMAFFPEFKYETYNRVMVKDNRTFIFKPNRFSFTNQNCHYTPLWYPDNMKYEVQTVVFDMWTPVGQLYGYSTDYIYIDGNVYDDYSIVKVHPSDPDYPRD